MYVKKIGIVSLSSGLLGEDVVKHEVEIGMNRLRDYGVETEYLPYANKGIAFLSEHPEARSKDLIQAFQDDSIDMILCAIGGEDTYRLLPYLFENQILQKVVRPKIFLGFSDTTINHLMLHKVGLQTFYGQAFLPDVCEMSKEMLPYTKKYFEELLKTGKIEAIYPSSVWYEERTDFSEKAIGVALNSHKNSGFELLRGASCFEGEILGGCLESLFDIFDQMRHQEMVEMCRKYEIFPTLEEWNGKILLLETSEEKPEPIRYQLMIQTLQDSGLFQVLAGVLIGKPQDESYSHEYKKILLETITNESLPILYNLNVGHASPRCIVPFGVLAKVDSEQQIIQFDW